MKECNVSGTTCIDLDSWENNGVIHIKKEQENGNFEIIISVMNLCHKFLSSWCDFSLHAKIQSLSIWI